MTGAVPAVQMGEHLRTGNVVRRKSQEPLRGSIEFEPKKRSVATVLAARARAVSAVRLGVQWIRRCPPPAR